MKSFGARQLVFALMILSVAAFGFAYAGSSTPWAGSALSVMPTASTPAPPIVTKGTVTPTSLDFSFAPDLTIPGVAVPTHYYVVADTVTTGETLAEPASARVRNYLGLIPGSTHTYQVYAGRQGFFSGIMWSDPTSLTVTLPYPVDPVVAAAVSLGKPSVPRSGRTNKAIRVSGTVSSANAISSPLPIKLKFYRLQKKGRKNVWVLRRTASSSGPSTGAYSASLKIKPAGTWSVIAETAGDAGHLPAASVRSRTFKIK